ncbi:ABC transporter permease [Anaerosacchariphilus polymeriproducens]|uniref:ABC transporter permease n=1 Tax=Anaerosacchariphilus polymeriproducens TaxID=1812858 RepID=A0A371AW81_9FIRM|nr:ABC transporter permease [Anaerosacchariphilus polymeriproducens]RDU23823.1 ABC transporter permease [Anaerosacchariphilus polymeriproducens]
MTKRLVLYLIRKRVRTVIVLGILFIITFMGILSITTQVNIEKTLAALREKTGACFAVEGKHDRNVQENWHFEPALSGGTSFYIGPDVDEALVSDIMEQEGLLSYDLYGNIPMYLENGKIFPGLWSDEYGFFYDGQKEEELPANELDLLWYGRMARNQIGLQGHADISKAVQFRSGNYSLAEGEFPSGKDAYEILISKQLAELNGFQIGDFIELSQKKCSWDSESMKMQEEDYFINENGPYKCKIVGIYTINVGGEYSKLTPEDSIPRNIIFGTFRFLDELKDPCATYDTEESKPHKYLNATFFVKDANQLDSVISNLIQKKVVDETYFKIYKDNTAFAQSANALNNMRIITWILTVLILGGGIALLLLLEKMWIEGRKRETGIYLASGIGKKQILGQYFLEQFFCLIPAVGVSSILSVIVAPKLGQLLFRSSGGAEEILLKDWSIHVGWMPIVIVALSSVVLCVVGTLIPGKKLIEMSPRELYSNLSIPVRIKTGWKKKRDKKVQEARKQRYSRWDKVLASHHYDCSNWKWRSITYLVRNRNRTVGMFLILFLTTTLLLSSLVIQEAAREGKRQLASSIGASFQIKKTEGKKVTQELADAVGKMKGIRSYNTTSISSPATKDLQLIPGHFAGSGEIWEKVPRVISCNASSNVHFFRDGEVKMKEGRELERDDSNACLISEDLAKQNKLSVGDSITLWLAEELAPEKKESINEEKQVEIVGIYSIETTDLVSDKSTEADKYANMIFTDAVTGDWLQTRLYGLETGEVNDNAEFFLSDPEQMESILAQIQEKYEVTKQQLTKNDKKYQESAASLTQLDSVMKILEKATIFISLFVLALVLTLWARERIQEIGIYLAGGIGKREILLQMLGEKLLIGITSFFAAVIVVAAFGTTLEQWMKNSVTKETAESLSGLQVFPDMKTLFVSFGLEMGIVLLAVGVSLLAVMRFKPKHILSQMSE